MIPSHFAPTWGLQGEAGGLGELAVFRVPEGVDGSGADAVVPTGSWLEGDLDFLAMASGWKSGLFGGRGRGEQSCCGNQLPWAGGVAPAGRIRL